MTSITEEILIPRSSPPLFCLALLSDGIKEEVVENFDGFLTLDLYVCV